MFYVVFPQIYSFLRVFAIDVASLGVSASASSSASPGSSAAIASAYLRRTRWTVLRFRLSSLLSHGSPCAPRGSLILFYSCPLRLALPYLLGVALQDTCTRQVASAILRDGRESSSTWMTLFTASSWTSGMNSHQRKAFPRKNPLPTLWKPISTAIICYTWCWRRQWKHAHRREVLFLRRTFCNYLARHVQLFLSPVNQLRFPFLYKGYWLLHT